MGTYDTFILACTSFRQDVPTPSGLIYNEDAMVRILFQTKELIKKNRAFLYAPSDLPAQGKGP